MDVSGRLCKTDLIGGCRSVRHCHAWYTARRIDQVRDALIRVDKLSVSPGGEVTATLAEPLKCEHCGQVSSNFTVVIPETPTELLSGIPAPRDPEDEGRPDPGE